MLRDAERHIKSDSFYYAGDNQDVKEVVQALKDGYKLIKPEKLIDYVIEYYKQCVEDCRGLEKCENCNEVCFSSVLGIIEDECK